MKRTELKRYTALRTHTRLQAHKAIGPGKGLRRRAHSTEPPTAEDLQRFERMRKLGCVACRLNAEHGLGRVHGLKLEIHHQLSGGVRIGHHAAVCLCRYHHQGDKWPDIEAGYSIESKRYGPSLAREPRAFRALYGDDAQLLTYQTTLLTESNP